MLKIKIPGGELFDDNTQEFIYVQDRELQLEHSLVSISKWESKWHEAFLGTKEKTPEQSLDYVKCMTITQNVDPNLYLLITDKIIHEIYAYIEDPMTATKFFDNGRPSGRRVITSEQIYSWMIQLNIPVEFQKWHLNRLLTLIRVCQIEVSPKKKMSKSDIYKQYHELNELRKAQFNTRG